MQNKFMVPIFTMALGLSVGSASASDFASLDEAAENSRVLEIAPVFDFDGDGCFPAAGISRTGEQNAGLDTTGSLGGDCRTSDFLNYSNTLHRSLCNTNNGVEYCGHFFSLYFEKDQVVAGWDPFGHRHDWEMAAVWTRDDVVTHGAVSAHGDMDTRDISQIPVTGEHIRVVYHKDGGTTHAMRFAGSSELAENPYGAFVTPPITSWFQMTGDGVSNSQMRSLLNTYDYGSASIPVKDSNFVTLINRFRPSSYPEFFVGEDCEYSNWFSEEGGANAVCSNDRVVTGIQCSGSYCDNKRLKCCNVPAAIPTGGQWEGSWLSEEWPNSWASDGAVVVGFRCSGRYCDNLKPILRDHAAEPGTWTSYFSEEQGLGQCAKGSYAAGIRCSGRYCDNVSLYCQDPLASNYDNLALNQSATQSSTGYGGVASRAVDGNTSGSWGNGSVTHTNNENQSWWQVDLGASAMIQAVKLYNRTDCCSERLSNYSVFVSDVPFESESVEAIRTQAGVSEYSFTSAPNPTELISVIRSGRYVRVQLHNSGFLSLAEVQVFGSM